MVGSLGLPTFCADIAVSGCTVTDLGIPLIDLFPVDSTYANARSVWGMAEYEGKIYVGCGNFDTNAGSAAGGELPLYGYDPQSGEWAVEYSVKDEQIARFYGEWGNLYISGTDPTSNSYGNIYYKENGIWATIGNAGHCEHIFDLLFMDDGKTVFAGVDPYTSAQPYVPRSVDGGKTWSSVKFKKDGALIPGASTVIYRTYNLFEYNGEVYATLWVSDSGNADHIGLYKYNAETDTMDYYAPTHESLYKPYMTCAYNFTFNGSFVNVYNGLYVFSEDLTSWESVEGYYGKPVCAQIIGDAMYMSTYAVFDDGAVSYLYKSTDLESFELIAAVKIADSYVLSFTYHDGLFYMGTSWAYPESLTNGTVFALKAEKAECTHDNLVTQTAEADCTDDGLSTKSCPDCGYCEKTVLPALGHDFADHACTVCGSSEPFRPGDANGDTFVNVLDTALTARYIAQSGYEGVYDLTGCDMSAADLNADGVIDQLDLNALARLILSEQQ